MSKLSMRVRRMFCPIHRKKAGMYLLPLIRLLNRDCHLCWSRVYSALVCFLGGCHKASCSNSVSTVTFSFGNQLIVVHTVGCFSPTVIRNLLYQPSHALFVRASSFSVWTCTFQSSIENGCGVLRRCMGPPLGAIKAIHKIISLVRGNRS